MKIGMLWFDNDPRTTFGMKIRAAGDYYRHKYHQEPRVCFVNPQAEKDIASADTGGITVKVHRSILPYNFWIGCGDDTFDGNCVSNIFEEAKC